MRLTLIQAPPLNPEDEETITKEMTLDEIEALKKDFAVRHLDCNLPEDHFITEFVNCLESND